MRRHKLKPRHKSLQSHNLFLINQSPLGHYMKPRTRHVVGPASRKVARSTAGNTNQKLLSTAWENGRQKIADQMIM